MVTQPIGLTWDRTMAKRGDNGRLRDAEVDAWRALSRAHSAFSRELEQELGAVDGLPLSSFTVLFELEAAPGRRLRMGDLATAAGLSRSGLSRLIDRLAAARLIERAECDDDGRGSFAVLTKAGAKRLQAARQTHAEAVARLFAGNLTSAELRTLSGLLSRLSG